MPRESLSECLCRDGDLLLDDCCFGELELDDCLDFPPGDRWGDLLDLDLASLRLVTVLWLLDLSRLSLVLLEGLFFFF